jgi:hypothetical protein
MKKKSILTNLGFFLLGVLVWFIIDLIWDWEGNRDAFKKGYNDAKSLIENTE